MRLLRQAGISDCEVEIENQKSQIRCAKLNRLESFLHFEPAALETIIEH
jgi:hypothetical protein